MSSMQPDPPARRSNRSPPATQLAGTRQLPPACGRQSGTSGRMRGYQRLAYLVGAGLILIGLAHAVLWALTGGSASGAV